MKKKNLIRLQDIAFGTIAVSSLFLLLGANGAFAATSVVDDVTVTVPAACTMSTTVDSNHTTTVEVGSYVDDIGETTFKVICNDSEGFSVYAVGYTNDTFGNTTMKPSIVADTNAIATGLATSGDTSNWAMKLTAITGDYAPTLETGFNAYHVVPAEYTKVASYSSNTDSSSGSSFKSTYAAFVASAQPADTYTGKVKYTVVHPANAATPGMVISDLTYMQDFSTLSSNDKASVLESMVEDTQYQLKDQRDEKDYFIAKLKDGKIWMTQNLDLNLDSNRTYLHADTDLGWGNDATTISWKPVRSTIDATNVTDGTIPNWTNDKDTPYSVDPGHYYWTDTYYESSGAYYLDNQFGNPIKWKKNEAFSGNGKHGHVGNYYNWPAAIATNDISNYSQNTYSSPSASPQNSICPAGWKLPSITNYDNNATGNNDFWNLAYYYNDKKINTDTGLVASPIYFVRGGYVHSSNLNNPHYNAYYWSNTSESSNYAYLLGFQSNNAAYTASYMRSYACSIRCIVR